MPGKRRQKSLDFQQKISQTCKNSQNGQRKDYHHQAPPLRALSVETAGIKTEFGESSFIPSDSKISPVLPVDNQTYKYLDMCDCSLLPNCALGDCSPLNEFEDDFDENKFREEKYQQISQKQIKEPHKRSKTRPETIPKNHHLRPPQHFYGSNLSSPGPSSSTQSPILGHSPSLSATSEASTESAPASFLFRLPLTISKVNRGIADCEVRAGSSCGSRKCQKSIKAIPIDFTEMGVFIAPSSDTDPDEAFVVVERRRLFVDN